MNFLFYNMKSRKSEHTNSEVSFHQVWRSPGIKQSNSLCGSPQDRISVHIIIYYVSHYSFLNLREQPQSTALSAVLPPHLAVSTSVAFKLVNCGL